MNARLRERGLTHRPRILAGPGCFVVENVRLIARNVWMPQVRLADSLPEAFSIAHAWTEDAK